MPERLTARTFTPLTGQVFRAVPTTGEPVDLVLSQCEETTFGTPAEWERAVRRVPFSVLFHARDGRFFEQQICTLHHPDLGALDVFLVPLGPDEIGMRYEAIFS